MLNMFWIGGVQDVQQVGKVVQETAPEAVQIIGAFKSVAAWLHMDIWWLTLAVFSFVWGFRSFARLPLWFAAEILRLPWAVRMNDSLGKLGEQSWWPRARNWMWRIVAGLFACCLCAFAQFVAPQTLPDVHWLILGPTYGLGAVIMYHVLDYMGVMAKLEKRGKGSG